MCLSIDGDIGTSPLYVYSSTFTSTPTVEQIYGTTSIIFWQVTMGLKATTWPASACDCLSTLEMPPPPPGRRNLTIVCLLKYVFIVMYAHHDGEGKLRPELPCRGGGVILYVSLSFITNRLLIISNLLYRLVTRLA